MRFDVVDELRAGVIPGRATGREVAGEHPLAERFGDHRGGVTPAGGGRDHVTQIGRRVRRDAVDHGVDEAHVSLDPAGEARVDVVGGGGGPPPPRAR